MWADPGGGYAILILLLLGVLGATLAPGGLRSRARAPQRLVAAALLVGAALTLLWPSLRARLRPHHSADVDTSRMAGLWTYETDTLSLDRDGRYSCRGAACTGLSSRGTWRVDADGRLIARASDGHDISWRIVRYNGRDRLGMSPSAGATWDAPLTFGRVSP